MRSTSIGMIQRLSLIALLSASACVDGRDPLDVETVRSVQLAVAPVFAVAPSAAEAGALTRARVTAMDASTGLSLASTQQDVDPSADHWSLTLTLDAATGVPLSIRIQTELASVSGATESVEWSGRTDAFTVVGGVPTEIRSVALFRGPLANLDVTGVNIENAPNSVLEGESVQLQASAEGPPGAHVFFRSEDPLVAVVDPEGRVQTLSAGTARIVAEAGPASAAVSFAVEDVVVPDAGELDGAISPQVDFTASAVVSTMEDPAAAAAISSSFAALEAALQAGDGAGAVQGFQSAVAAWEQYGAGTALRSLDAPQLGVIELTLIAVADALGIDFG